MSDDDEALSRFLRMRRRAPYNGTSLDSSRMDITCPECQKEGLQPLAELVVNDDAICPYCGFTFDLEDWRSKITEAADLAVQIVSSRRSASASSISGMNFTGLGIKHHHAPGDRPMPATLLQKALGYQQIDQAAEEFLNLDYAEDRRRVLLRLRLESGEILEIPMALDCVRAMGERLAGPIHPSKDTTPFY